MAPPHLPVKYGPVGGEAPSLPPDLTDLGRYYPSFDNQLWMFYRLWMPREPTKTVATLMIVHGTVDHSGVYEEFAKDLSAHGVAVVAMDMRGWGLSDGESMYFNSLETFCRDVHHLSEKVHGDAHLKHIPATKRFLLGKSLGGLITAYCVGKYYPDHWKGGLIGLSGAYQLDPEAANVSALAKYAISLLSMIAPKLPVKELFSEDLIVADKDALEAWRNDPLCCKDKFRVGYIVELLRSTQEFADNPLVFELPVMIAIGTNDRVVNGHQMVVEQCTNRHKQLNEYPEGRHNLLQEPSLKESVMHDIRIWILERSDAD